MDPETPPKESLSAIKAYVDRGAIRHVGVSGACSRSSRPAGSFRSAPCRTATAWPTAGTTTVVDFREREGIASVPYYPLSGDDGPRVAAAAKRLGVTGTMVKLAWVLGAVVLPIPGTLSIEHVRGEPRGARAPAGRPGRHRGLRHQAALRTLSDRSIP
jgi:aryl-alcohol dehydrogenase-like predicted oxidoreductase